MKRFNTTGVCVPKKNYMVNIDGKLDKIEELIEEEFYFVINRPRQFGKTTTLNELYKRLNKKYTVLRVDFELIGEEFVSEERFCEAFRKAIARFLSGEVSKVKTLTELSYIIMDLTENREIILIIDEVDKNSNNKIFLSFLGMLRSLYLSREQEMATTFKSVILAGVYDIKNLKLKIRENEEVRYNSPWNIAVRFDINMSFNIEEIGSMLKEYSIENNLELNIEELSKEIYKFTSGYPFLVSRICQIIDENILVERKVEWTKFHIQRAIKLLLEENNTLFDDLVKNVENNRGLYKYIYNLLVLNIPSVFNIDNPIINFGVMLGYLDKDKENNVIISNKIIRERLYNYMISRTDTNNMSSYNFKSNFITENNGLDMEKVLLRFQQFMKEN